MSVYSTPLVSVCDDDSVSSEESFYFTPEVSSTSITSTPNRSVRSSVSSLQIESVSCINDVTPVGSPSASDPVRILNNNVNFRIKEWNPADDKENHNGSVPTKTLVECTPKMCRSIPLKCITNIVTPIQNMSIPLKFDDQIIQLEKEIIKSARNNSFESTSPVYRNNLLNPKLKNRAKNSNKNKFTFLQRIGIRSKSKMEYDRLIEEDLISPKSISSRKINDSANFVTSVADVQRLTRSEYNANTPSKTSINDVKVIDEYCSSPISQKGLKNVKSTFIWWNFYQYPKVFVLKSIRLSPVKRLFTRCRKKLSNCRFKNLFVSKPLDKKPESIESNAQTNPCSCSVTVLQNQELLSKILLKLNALEEQISDIKYSVKNNNCSGMVSVNCLPPPPPPPLPPPPPPLPNLLLTSTEVLKRNVMTPKDGQTPKGRGPLKTQFAITVEDIKSVKLRKTPSTMKKSLAGTPQTPGIKDGVLHSVKFKPIKRTVAQKKELSNLVAEILSPSHKTEHGERNCVVNAKLLQDKENPTISTNFEITPVKSKNKSTKFRATKRRDSSLDSPTRRRMNTAHKTLVFCDKRVLRYD